MHVSFDLPRDVISSLRPDPERFVREIRLAAAAKWFENRFISQSTATEMAGISRAEFLRDLERLGVSPIQYDAAEGMREVGPARALSVNAIIRHQMASSGWAT